MMDLTAQRELAQRVIARWMKGITPMIERSEAESRHFPIASKNVPVSRHDHVGQMVYGDDACLCEGCGQEWTLKLDARRRPSEWVPERWHRQQRSWQEAHPQRRPVSSFDPDEDAA